MSLTSHLDDANSPVRKFLEKHFPTTRTFVRNCNKKLSTAETIRPSDKMSTWQYAMLGQAIDYRTRFYFQMTPVRELVAWRGAMMAIDGGVGCDSESELWEDATEEQCPTEAYNEGEPFVWQADEHAELVVLRLIDGTVQKYIGPDWSTLFLEPYAGPALSKVIVDGFFHSLEDTLAQLSPAGRRLDRSDEELLARYCVVLSRFEQIFRMGGDPNSLLFALGPEPTVSELLAIAEDSWIEDLCSMSWLFYDRCNDLLSGDVVLNPIFTGSTDIGGGDADLIVNGCLIDIKATVNPKVSKDWLYQLIGYSLLDYNDEFGIQKVGIYFTRQGILLQWFLQDLIEDLSGGPSLGLPELRKQFQGMLSH